ncbi:MAG TPA: hypothetical protein PL045_06210, partial [Chitinophagaceae bacterium]|nr:hypothetical protein [Chitinophagaceae bacterium]
MKKLLFLAVAAVLSFTAICQTNQSINLKNSNGNVFRYGKQAILTTTDSTNHTIATLSLNANEAGVVEVQVVAFDSTHGLAVTGSKIVRYVKT